MCTGDEASIRKYAKQLPTCTYVHRYGYRSEKRSGSGATHVDIKTCPLYIYSLHIMPQESTDLMWPYKNKITGPVLWADPL
jgi:hypothetical protein